MYNIAYLRMLIWSAHWISPNIIYQNTFKGSCASSRTLSRDAPFVALLFIGYFKCVFASENNQIIFCFLNWIKCFLSFVPDNFIMHLYTFHTKPKHCRIQPVWLWSALKRFRRLDILLRNMIFVLYFSFDKCFPNCFHNSPKGKCRGKRIDVTAFYGWIWNFSLHILNVWNKMFCKHVRYLNAGKTRLLF